MAEKYDFIVVGGGHQGLTCAAYLAKAKQKVLVLERLGQIGGGVLTVDGGRGLTLPDGRTTGISLPGFKHNLHSMMHELIHIGPVMKDLELESHGAKYVVPHAALATVFPDGSSIVWYREKERTMKQIEYFSPRDAKTYGEFYDYFSRMNAMVAGVIFNHPLEPGKQELLLWGTPEGRDLIWLRYTSTDHALNSLFESDYVKSMFALMITQMGTNYDAPGTGAFLPVMLMATHHVKLAVGGSSCLAFALGRVIEENGGVIKTSCEVRQIKVKNGRAESVTTADGQEFIVNKGVACNIGPTLVFGDNKLIEERDIPQSERASLMRQVKRFKPEDLSLFGPHYALDAPFLFKAAEKNPDVNKSWYVGICHEGTYSLRHQMNMLRSHIPPHDAALGAYIVLTGTKDDPTQAPAGKHNGLIWLYTPYEIHDGGPEKWDEIKETYCDKLDEHLSQYTIRPVKEITLARFVHTPADIVRMNPSMIGASIHGGAMEQCQVDCFRPFYGYGHHGTPFENIFMCGPSSHPGGGVSGACGYLTANVITERFKIKRWWDYFKPEMGKV